MLGLPYDYESCVCASERVSWTLDDVMARDKRLDFSRPFLPNALAGRRALPFLSPTETRTLNQITGNAYLNLFGIVEESIIATVVELAGTALLGDPSAARALLRFGDEELKHQLLFQRFLDAFRRDSGFETEVLGSASEVAQAIRSRSPIAVMMLTLHLEIATQTHYVECVRDDDGVDPFFAKLLRMHWLDESQHARIDALELDKMLDTADRASIAQAFDDYIVLLDTLDERLECQAQMDARSVARAIARPLDARQSQQVTASQHAGYRRTFLTYGMTNPTFARHLETISPGAAVRVRDKAAQLSSPLMSPSLRA